MKKFLFTTFFILISVIMYAENGTSDFKDVNWGDSSQNILNKEGELKDASSCPQFSMYIYDDTFLDESVSLYYLVSPADKLYQISYIFDIKNKNESLDEYYRLQKMLKENYNYTGMRYIWLVKEYSIIKTKLLKAIKKGDVYIDHYYVSKENNDTFITHSIKKLYGEKDVSVFTVIGSLKLRAEYDKFVKKIKKIKKVKDVRNHSWGDSIADVSTTENALGEVAKISEEEYKLTYHINDKNGNPTCTIEYIFNNNKLYSSIISFEDSKFLSGYGAFLNSYDHLEKAKDILKCRKTYKYRTASVPFDNPDLLINSLQKIGGTVFIEYLKTRTITILSFTIDEEKTENMYKTIILSTSKEFTNKKEEEEKVSGE